jgi:hypothetical protein
MKHDVYCLLIMGLQEIVMTREEEDFYMTFAGRINLAKMRETVLKGQGADKRFLLFMAAYGIDMTEGRDYLCNIVDILYSWTAMFHSIVNLN